MVILLAEMLKWKKWIKETWKESDEKKERRNSKPVVKESYIELKLKKKNLHKLINCFVFIIICWYLNKVYFHFALHFTTSAHT
jgi:hypothetical protein